MLKQYRTFLKAVLITILSIIIVLIMYSYTNDISQGIVQDNIRDNNLNRLRILVNSLDHSIEQLNMLSVAITADSKVKLHSSIDLMNNYEQDQLMLDISEKIKLQTFTQGWDVEISFHSTLLSKWAGKNPNQQLPDRKEDYGVWILEQSPSKKQFSLYRNYDSYTIRVAFPIMNIVNLLNSAKLDNNDPFFYHPDTSEIIANSSSDLTRIHKLLSKFNTNLGEKDEGTEIIAIESSDYLLSYLRSEELGWYLIDYVPLDEALQPIIKTRTFFIIACTLLLLSGLVTILFFYRKVQVPILDLLKGVRTLRDGDYSHRIQKKSNNEFDILYHNFNEMAQQIEELIENVYKEKIISREAMIKQLQAQINPHFLYNCLFFIDNMNRLGNDEAVHAMTQNLAEYFRYMTRLEDPMTTLEREIGVVRNYLNIQSMRMNRLRYEIDIPDSMMTLNVPKLLIQPLVENSIIHGIENKLNAGYVRIVGRTDGKQVQIIVEDDGKGMTQEEIQVLLERIEQPLDENFGCALWNIWQRLQIGFGPNSSLTIEPSALGGLKVELKWDRPNETEERS